MAAFLLALCQPGAERALKEEARVSGFASGYQRPGLVTFKSTQPLQEDAAFPAVFARHIGLSLGKVERAELPGRLDALGASHIHVVSTHVEDDDAWAAADALRLELGSRAALPARDAPGPPVGARIATVILVDDELWMTVHRHRRDRSPDPGGRMRPDLPSSSPSRAWLKLTEAARIFQLGLREGQRALELGSAPGGATRALLDRGLHVIGVDPNAMDPRILSHPRFEHRRTTSLSVAPGTLPPLHWVALDVNVPPRTALRGALPFVKHHAASLEGVILTLKMKSWDLAQEIPGWMRRIGSAAPQLELVARQLSSNGQEICVIGRRRPPRIT